MTRQRMTKEAEERIVAGVERVVDLVNEGAHPNDALTKVARDGDYLPGHVQLMVQAYNTGRTNHQRKSHSDLFDKTATFPVADPKVVLNALYPSEVKTAAAKFYETVVSEDYSLPPERFLTEGMEKVAAFDYGPAQAKPYPRDPERFSKTAFALLKDLERERENLRMQVSHTHDKLAAALDRLDDYFRTFDRPISYPAALANSVTLWGEPARAVLTKVAQANPGLLSETYKDRPGGKVEKLHEPYRSLLECVKFAEDHGRLSLEYDEFSKAAVNSATELLNAFLPPLPERPVTGSIMGGSTKQALFDQVGPLAAANVISDSIMGKIRNTVAPDEDKLKYKALLSITDPSHEARLRKVRTQAMLHHLMANDEFIGAEHPEKVTGLFNQINELTPRASESPIMMQALLRRYLAQGQVDPHDLDQLVGVESKLKDIGGPDQTKAKMMGLIQDKPRGEAK